MFAKTVVSMNIFGILAITAAPIDPWIQLGGIGVLGFLLWVVLAKTIPNRDRLHREEVKEHVDALSDMSASLSACSDRHAECSNRIEHAIRDGNAEQLKLLKVATGLRDETKI